MFGRTEHEQPFFLPFAVVVLPCLLYTSDVYKRQVFMNREADEAGLSAWVNVLGEGQSREHVFNGFADSPEFQELCRSYGIA